jgi:hypothetical protein
MSDYVLGDWRRAVVERIAEVNNQRRCQWWRNRCPTDRSNEKSEIQRGRIPLHRVAIQVLVLRVYLRGKYFGAAEGVGSAHIPAGQMTNQAEEQQNTDHASKTVPTW